MAEPTAGTGPGTTNDSQHATPQRTTRQRAIKSPSSTKDKKEERKTVKKVRKRAKSVGPGAKSLGTENGGRRNKFEKKARAQSLDNKKKPRQNKITTQTTLDYKKEEMKEKKGKETNKVSKEAEDTMKPGEKMDTEMATNKGKEGMTIKVKEEMINTPTKKKKNKEDAEMVAYETHEEVEFLIVKSPEESRRENAAVSDVIEIEDEQENADETMMDAEEQEDRKEEEDREKQENERIQEENRKKEKEAELRQKLALAITAVPTEQEEKMPEGEDSEDITPTSGKNTYNWAAAVSKESPQRVLQTHEKTKYAFELLAEITFVVGRNCDELPLAIEASIFREVLIHVFKRGKEVDHKFVINAYHADTNLPSIKRIEDIPLGLKQIRAYMPHLQIPPRRIRQGKNPGYRVRMSFSIVPDEFVHYWELSKRTYTKVPFVTLKKTPMQDSTTYNTAGFFVNSSEKQCNKQLQEALSKQLNTQIGLQFRPAAVDRYAQDTLWKEAKANAGGVPKEIYRNAPLSLQVYAKSQAHARQVAAELYAKYGQQEKGQYPRLPDGSRMRFVPASHFLDMKSRPMAVKLLRQQISFTRNTIASPIPVKDPYQRFESQDNKTMQELILDLKCIEKDEEPYFRHVVKKWTREYNAQAFEVKIHSNMYAEAAKILRKLPEILTAKYGKEVADALSYTQQEGDTFISQELSVITLDTEDRYMNGNAQFIFTGLETLAQRKHTPNVEEERSMNVRSNLSGLSGHQTFGTLDDSIGSNNMEVDKHIGDTPATRTTAQDPGGGWKQVGSIADRDRLRQRIMSASNPDPGDTQGRQYP